MNTQLATTSPGLPEAVTVDETLLSDFMQSAGVALKLSTPERMQFFKIATLYNLNPFKREIYCTKYGEGQWAQFAIIVGYETYLKRADRTGKLDGWEVEFKGEGDNLSCIVTIFRKDWNRPLKHEVWYSEVVQKKKDGSVNSFWQKQRQQTRKVAISQAFRLAFPDELGGMPYTNDELGVQDIAHDVVTEAPAPAAEVVEATVVQPAPPPPPKMNKKELADSMAALTAWQNEFDTIEVTPKSYLAHGKKLKALKGLTENDMKAQFKALVNVAANRGIDWDRDEKAFYWSPDAVTTTEETPA